jgi:hypothetical protein
MFRERPLVRWDNFHRHKDFVEGYFHSFGKFNDGYLKSREKIEKNLDTWFSVCITTYTVLS